MLPEMTLDEAFKNMVKEYITENLSVSVILDTYETGGPRSVEVILTLDGENISSNTDWF